LRPQENRLDHICSAAEEADFSPATEEEEEEKEAKEQSEKEPLFLYTLFTRASIIALKEYQPFAASADILTWEKMGFFAEALELSVVPAAKFLAPLQIQLDGLVFGVEASETDENIAEWGLLQALCAAAVQMDMPNWQGLDCEDQHANHNPYELTSRLCKLIFLVSITSIASGKIAWGWPSACRRARAVPFPGSSNHADFPVFSQNANFKRSIWGQRTGRSQRVIAFTSATTKT
jgi:hypothetical protein